MLEVLDGRSFTQEFGIVDDSEVPTGALSARRLESGNDETAHDPRQDSGTDDDHVMRRCARECTSNLLASPAEAAEIEAAIGAARRADADHGHVAFGDRRGGIRR